MSSYSKASAAGVVLLVTIIEDAGLIAWLVLARASMFYQGIPIAPLLLLLVLLVEHSIMQRAENPSLYFFVGFYIEHQITENVITQQPYLRFRNARGAITAGVILETLSEGVGARLWLLYGPIGPVFLVLGSLIEHSIQYVVGRIPTRSTAINVQPIAKN